MNPTTAPTIHYAYAMLHFNVKTGEMLGVTIMSDKTPTIRSSSIRYAVLTEFGHHSFHEASEALTTMINTYPMYTSWLIPYGRGWRTKWQDPLEQLSEIV